VTLNDPQFVEAARHLAQKAVKAGDTPQKRADFLARRILSRPLRSPESKIILGIQSDLEAHYRAKPTEAKKLIEFGDSKTEPTMDAPTLAAWTMVVNALFNLDEVLNK
jgi:hypothetical protein